MADDPKPSGTNGGTDPGVDGADDADEEAEALDEPADGGGPAVGPVTGEGSPGDGDDEPVGADHSGDRQAPGGADGRSGRVAAEARSGAPGNGTSESHVEGTPDASGGGSGSVPADVRKYQRFKKVDGAQYDRVNEFLRERTYVTAREWALARLCADFRTETGVEMTKIGENLPELVPFMEDTYSPQAVNQARSSFEQKVNKAGATFLYGAMCDFFTAEELDELMYEVTEVAKFLLEVEGIDLAVEEELEAEDRISGVMREVREASEALRYEECPHCGEHLRE